MRFTLLSHGRLPWLTRRSLGKQALQDSAAELIHDDGEYSALHRDVAVRQPLRTGDEEVSSPRISSYGRWRRRYN